MSDSFGYGSTGEAIEPIDMAWTEDTDLPEAVLTSLGAASMCWSGEPTGVFQSDLVLQIAQSLMEWINEHYVLADDYLIISTEIVDREP